jgi:hypothetical protein
MRSDPDLVFFGFSLWVDGRQYPDADDHWDSNWLIIRAIMEAHGARVMCEGAILTTMDLRQFRDELVKMVGTLTGEAGLVPLEPELKAIFKMQTRGQLEATIEITPDHPTQHHQFIIDADQSYLPALVASCDDILARFPVKNEGGQV